ncbi:Cytochrome c oxidase bioproteinsis protein Cmc1-like isoform 2 [Hibiscus syriacus]|uniref:COX assembly mitochondrial protein n=1 Tax=Hibiscus syriacus TaxID=106335 RepID=A0A6A3CFL0_HIBSY|nr:Cytochrome c oxidase bioproteinsis protein Cmc1-like isoform 2 [Hibiscus syriacus]
MQRIVDTLWKKALTGSTGQIIEEFQKCHLEHPIAKFFDECTELKIKLDRCFRQEVKSLKRKVNFEESKKLKERLQALRRETAENDS